MMKISPEDYAAIHMNADLSGIQASEFDLKQQFIDMRDWDGLTAFYKEVIAKSHLKKYGDRVLAISMDTFDTMLKQSLYSAIKIAQEDNRPAIYYQWERSAACSDFFVCASFIEDDPDWAANVSQIINGPDIQFTMPDWLENTLRPDQAIQEGIPGAEVLNNQIEKLVADGEPIQLVGCCVYDQELVAEYFDAIFLASLGREWDKVSLRAIRLGAAQHDYPIHIYQETP